MREVMMNTKILTVMTAQLNLSKHGEKNLTGRKRERRGRGSIKFKMKRNSKTVDYWEKVHAQRRFFKEIQIALSSFLTKV